MKTRRKLMLSCLFGLLVSASGAAATTRTVTNLNDSGSGSLRDTLTAAADGDQIVFADNVRGTLTLTSAELNMSKAVSIIGPGANLLTIARSSASGTPAFRLFHVTTTNSTRIVISGLTLAGGLLTDTFGDGACIYNNAPNLTVQSVHFRDNRASKNGGAIYHDATQHGLFGADSFLDSCTFSGNYAGESGGAIYSNGSDGGHAFIDVDNCTFYRNGAGVSGGAVYAVALRDGSASTTFGHSTFVENIGGNASSGTSVEADGGSIGFGGCVSYSSSALSFVERNGGSIGSYGYNVGQPRDHPFLSAQSDRLLAGYQLDPVGLQPNGSSVPTIAVVRGQAVDGSHNFSNHDARGRARPHDFPEIPNRGPFGNGNDSGAYEADDLVQKGLTAANDFILTVNSIDDHDDNTCGETDCTLREAVRRVNAARAAGIADRYIIGFNADLAGTIMLKRELNQLEVHGGVSIWGPGARKLAVSGGGYVRVFYFSAPGESSISGLTIRDGNVSPSGDRGASTEGGGILNAGELTLTDCHLLNNDAAGDNNTAAGGDGGTGAGGAIHNTGNLILNRCTLADNAASGGGGGANSTLSRFTRGGDGGSGLGGAISNAGTLTVTNCTLAKNRGSGAAGGDGNSGGNGGKGVAAIYSTGSSMITATTITDNFSEGVAGGAAGGKFSGDPGAPGAAIGGVGVTGGANVLRNTLCAANTGRDVDGAFTSQGFNLIGVGDFSSGFNSTGDIVGTSAAAINPKLGALQNSSGATDTIALAADSLALDAGNSFGLTMDQRFARRPFDRTGTPNPAGGDGTDIGACEAQEDVAPAPVTRIVNISTRLRVETGDDALIGGFIVTGSAQKRILVRALGPSLPVTDALANPRLDLFDGNGQPIASNDNWQDAPNRQEIIDSTIPPPNDLEAAILTNVNAGPHTAVVSGTNGGTGVGLVEVYDLGSAQEDSRLANISTRGRVLNGDNVMIGGLIITGASPQKLIIRAIGPSLPVGGALPDPFLQLVDGNGSPLASNDNWKETQQSEVEATTIPPANDLESAIVTSLPPAAYTAVVSGANGATGVGLVEVYALP